MKENIKIRNDDLCVSICTIEHIEEIIEFIYRLNNRVESASNFCPKSKEYIKEEILNGINDNSFFIYWENNKVLGTINYYLDEVRNNADCTLLIDSKICDYNAVANILFKKVKDINNIDTKYTFFFPKENIDCSNFLESINAKREVNEYGLIMNKDGIKNEKFKSNVNELPIDYYEQFKNLHNEIFPDVYISGTNIVESIGNKYYVYSIVEDNTLIAYSVLRLNGDKSATAEVIGVRESFRGKGYGKTVINYLIEKAFNSFGISQIDLIVDADNEKAIKLYLDLGFAIEHENRCYTA